VLETDAGSGGHRQKISKRSVSNLVNRCLQGSTGASQGF
jgi:hypothetical protein